MNATNVVVFIADSLRYDHLPERIAKNGITTRSIAPSTYTATSIPSMMTGRYPVKNRVWNFNDSLKSKPEIFRHPNSGMDLRNVWVNIDNPSQKPPNRVLRLQNQELVKSAAEPFTVVIHEKGAHAPYDFFHVEWDSSPPYFEHFAGQDDKIREEYSKGSEAIVKRFFDEVEKLKERGIYNNTLVIFTSDHGELLGEMNRGGIYAHGSPICPELVEVPLVFSGCGLPEGERLEGLYSGVDLAPTILGAQGRDIPTDLDGFDLWHNEVPENRIARSEFWANTGKVKYGASSAWDSNGGVVSHHGSAMERLLFAIHRKLYKGAQAPANRRLSLKAIWRLLRTYGPSYVVYGNPDLEATRSELVTSFEYGRDQSDANPVSKEQLRALGYVE